MPDSRIAKLADVLVTHSTRLQPGEKVLIEGFDAPDEVIAGIIERICNLNTRSNDPREYTDPEWTPSMTELRSWQIRRPDRKQGTPIPDADESFISSIKHCRRCKNHIFDDPNVALQHLRSVHFNSTVPVDDARIKEWIYNKDESIIERVTLAVLATLDQAVLSARSFYDQLKELADGVRDDTGALADLYTFPRKLLETFRRLVIFYMGVDRGLFFVEKYYRTDYRVEAMVRGQSIDFCPKTVPVLQKLGQEVEIPLLQARESLCDMARSSIPTDISERISLSPEYVCSWLMRRLMVKPLARGMPIADMYREYLSTLVGTRDFLARHSLRQSSNSRSTTGQANGSCAP